MKINFSNHHTATRIGKVHLFLAPYADGDHYHFSLSALNDAFGYQSNPLSKYLRELLLIVVNEKYSKDAGVTKKYMVNQDGLTYLQKLELGEIDCEYHVWETEYNQRKAVAFNKEEEKAKLGKKLSSPPSSYHYVSYSPATADEIDDNPMSEFEFKTERLNSKFKVIVDKYNSAFKTGNVKYTRKSNRKFHGIQNIEKIYREPLSIKHGYKCDYDIDCAIQTILTQLARRFKPDLELPAIDAYMQNKNEFRLGLASAYRIKKDSIKIILNSLMYKCPIAPPSKDTRIPEPSIFIAVGRSSTKLYNLKDDHFIQCYQQDIAEMWKALDPVVPKYYKDDEFNKDGTPKKVRVAMTDYASVYFKYETEINDVIEQFMKDQPTRNKTLLFHDGWICEQPIDQTTLIEMIKKKTGFQVQLKLRLIS